MVILSSHDVCEIRVERKKYAYRSDEPFLFFIGPFVSLRVSRSIDTTSMLRANRVVGIFSGVFEERQGTFCACCSFVVIFSFVSPSSKGVGIVGKRARYLGG